MSGNIIKSEFSEAALLGFGLSQAKAHDPKNLQRSYRTKLSDRFRKGGIKAVADYELLELILFRAIPHLDVRPLSKLLLKQFGTFNGVLNAQNEELAKIDGISLAAITELKVVQSAAHMMAFLDVKEKEVLTAWDQLIRYCRTMMAGLDREQFRVLFLDTKNVLILDECLQIGIVNHVPVYPRQVAKRALDVNASAVILVHNHPSGNSEPSVSDIAITHEIIDALKALDIAVHDHVIIGSEGETSLKNIGLI